MSTSFLDALVDEDEVRAVARSRAYAIVSAAMDFPDSALCCAIQNGEISDALRATLASVNIALLDETDWSALADTAGEDAFAIEFTRLFEVGSSGPPCPLYGGVYDGARTKTVEEAIRFYNHFGLTLAEDPREPPDHLITELDFLHYLAFREAEALHEDADAGPYRRAQRDFVARHPGRWVPRLAARLERTHPLRFYRELVSLLARMLKHDERYLVRVTGPAAEERGG